MFRRHYLPASEDIVNTIKELLQVCYCLNIGCHHSVMKGLTEITTE
jgi:hypothetical protein